MGNVRSYAVLQGGCKMENRKTASTYNTHLTHLTRSLEGVYARAWQALSVS